MMGKRDHIKRVFKGLRHSTKTSASESASEPSGTALEPRLSELTDRTKGTPLTSKQLQDAPDARDLWGLALEKLSLEDKEALLSQIKPDSKLDILRHLHVAARKKQIDCEDHRWKFELNGRQIILRDVAEKIVVWIDKFKQIGDIAVNFDPVHASLPWAGITVAESQQMGALLTGVEKMTDLIGRCQIYEALYLNEEQFKQDEWKHEEWAQAAMNLTSALVALYAVMLNFLGSAIRAYSQRGIVRILCAILSPSEVIGFQDKCQSLENNLAIEVDNCERIHTRASSAEQTQKLKKILVDLETPILRTDSRVAALCERLDSSERLSILKWISSIPYRENHDFARQGRKSKTGAWLLQHKQYREWRASSTSMILWLHGDPGAGKTKLVSTVIDSLLESFENLPNDEAFAYFYCDRNQSDRREPGLILSSFVRQLSTSRNNDAIPHPTVQMYNQKKKQSFASTKLEMEESRTVLAELFQIYPQITLVVDALDECDKESRTGFIDMLYMLIAESPKPVKILISSRRDNDIKHRFQGGPNLEIRAVDNRDDIAIFVNQEITACEKLWQNEFSFKTKQLICNTLVERSEGMFQWVVLQIATLRQLCRELCREHVIQDRLGKLPKTLETAYDEIYLRIKSQDESTLLIAERAFQWVMCSCWPLSPAELVEAVCQDPDTDETDETDININNVLSACQNLLVVDQVLNICRFSHLSVQEYFEKRWSSCEADCLVGKVCLSFLIDQLKQDAQPMRKEDRNNSARSDLLEYACFNWMTHVQRLEKENIFENRLTALLKCFLGSMDQSSPAYQNWHKMIGEYYKAVRYLSKSRSSSPLIQTYNRLSPCVLASWAIVVFGFHKTILDWWTFGFADINQKNSNGETLLYLGTFNGSVSITEDLLRKGAEVNATGGDYGSVLQAASYSGHKSVVQMLLDKGAEVNVIGGIFGNALEAASYSGHKSVVQILLDKGAEINATGGEYGSALQAASISGNESVVQLLLDNGADVNTTSGEYGSALQAASFWNCESVVKLLLDNGADVNTTGGEYGSALQAASYWVNGSVVQMLLDNGADVNTTGGIYGSALRAASSRGNELVVQMLLDKGADVNATGESFGSAVQAASYNGNKPVVRMFKDKGADVNVTGGTFGSAVQAASFFGHKSVVQMLLDNGADVNTTGGEYGSALQAASCRGLESVVQMLLDKGADINTTGGAYGSALQTASYWGNGSVVQMLLDNGADLNATGGHYGSGLQAASYNGNESVVQMLLDNGADVNATGGAYGSALQAASCRGHESVVQMLLDKGADINTTGGFHGSALQAASYWGNGSVVQMLLDKGADVNATGGRYGSALEAASTRGKMGVVKLLQAAMEPQ